MSRLARKLDVLRSERDLIHEEVEANEALGRTVTSRVASLATPPETNKVTFPLTFPSKSLISPLPQPKTLLGTVV